MPCPVYKNPMGLFLCEIGETMKWFKHETDAFHSEMLTQIIDEFGFEGYGRFWRLLELVAERMDDTDRHHLCLLEKVWCKRLGTSPKVLERFLKYLGKVSGILATYSGNNIEISIPNLLKKRDNYSRNKQATCQSVSPREEKKREEKNITTTPLSTKADMKVILEAFEEDWLTLPRKSGKKDKAFKKYKSTVGNNLPKNRPLFQSKVAQFNKAMEGREKQFIPMGDTFLNNWQSMEWDEAPNGNNGNQGDGKIAPAKNTDWKKQLEPAKDQMKPEELKSLLSDFNGSLKTVDKGTLK
jgi:hypothetical protein